MKINENRKSLNIWTLIFIDVIDYCFSLIVIVGINLLVLIIHQKQEGRLQRRVSYPGIKKIM